MTSKRNIERRLDELKGDRDDDSGKRIVLKETTVGTGRHDDLKEEETETKTTVVELSGSS